MHYIALALLACVAAATADTHIKSSVGDIPPPWSADRAWQWYNSTPWIVGANFIPSTADNELEMWQPATYDPATIDRELGYMHDIVHMNAARVFLHYLPYWYSDGTPSDAAAEQFLDRIDNFLSIADKHHIKPLLVLFDDCWDQNARPGPQLEPIPFVHNSRWVTSPDQSVRLTNASYHEQVLKPYVMAVLNRFGKDPRVLGWDLYNEANGNSDFSQLLLQEVFAWAREANPSQPITICLFSGRWDGQGNAPQDLMNQIILANVDVITFHNYSPLDAYSGSVNALRMWNRPIICTEYMARTLGSTFQGILPYAHDQRIGSFNWGFVNGRTQTIYPWDSWTHHYDGPPAVWFHDILWANATPFDQSEVDLIVKLIDNSALPINN